MAHLSKSPLSMRDKTLIMQTINWLKTIIEAQPAGTPWVYPTLADIDDSLLFKRIRQGLTPMPWAPPTRDRQPAYELIENARGQHRVKLDAENTAPNTLSLDGALWRILANDAEQRTYHLAYGSWPLTYLLHASDQPRWPQLPKDIDDGLGHDVVRFPDGRLIPKDLLRRTRDDIETQWLLRCASPLNERLYLNAERLSLDSAEFFRVDNIYRTQQEYRAVFSCPLRQHAMTFWIVARDPWTRISRYVAAHTPDAAKLERWLSLYDAGQSPLEFLPETQGWQVFEIDERGLPCSAWRTTRRELLEPITTS